MQRYEIQWRNDDYEIDFLYFYALFKRSDYMEAVSRLDRGKAVAA